MSEKHCETCVCGRRAPVQGDHRTCENPHGPGTVSWTEHCLAMSGYAREYGQGQTAERMAERGGLSYYELTLYLGREPTTWAPR